ncbi:hypothetical protein LEP1GSC175_0535 [Leptospira santarosai str. HAI821]|nr:hypothetical protein LEP1GSC175_0535 [Leptospira santarosai str. HAI821]
MNSYGAERKRHNFLVTITKSELRGRNSANWLPKERILGLYDRNVPSVFHLRKIEKCPMV